MNPRYLRSFLLAASMACALPAVTSQAFSAEFRCKPGGPGSMPPPCMGGAPGDMPMGMRDGRDGPPEFGHGMGGLPPHLRGLDLSVTQRDRIAEIYQPLAATMRDKAGAVAVAQNAMRELALSETYDEAKAKALAETAAGNLADIAREHARADQAVFRLLTPEQRARVKERSKCPMPGFGPPMPPRREF